MVKRAIPQRLVGRVMLLVLVCFFLSGLTGLIYEILWTRMIVKVIGTAPFAVSIVLTVFMAGLGLGSYIASRTIDRVKAPLKLVRIYGMLELAVGCYALLLPMLLVAFRPIYAVIYNRLFNYFMLYSFLTFLGCSVLLVFPVICMGATLPILCCFYVTRLAHLGTKAGRLYGLNTIGAAAGALVCGFWLINLLGVWGTLVLAVGINAVIGISCILVSYGIKGWPVSPKQLGPGSERLPAKEAGDKPQYTGAPTGALIIFAVSGFCAMAYEVIWTKLLGVIVGPTTYSFTIVLVTFIVGLALGSIIFGRLADRIEKPIKLLIFTQFAAALFALGLSQVFGNSQLFFAKLIYHFKGNFMLLSLLKAAVLFFFMLLPTLCLGATFPLVGKIFTQSLSKLGRSIGFAYAINTVGAVLGSFCAGFVLIPLIGKEQGLTVVVAIQLCTSLLVGVCLLWLNREKISRWVPLAATALVGLVLCYHYPEWDRLLLSEGKYHRFRQIRSEMKRSGWLEALLRGPKILAKSERRELIYYGDGIGGFTTVLKSADAFGNTSYSLAISGKTDASPIVDMATQTLVTHLPMLFHPEAKTVMVLGLASGISAGEVLHYPVERVDVLEISKEVVAASDFFVPWNNSVLSNPKTNLIIQDGRAHLQLTRQRYDVIISEPSNPWMAGLAALFSREWFEAAKDKLNENGIFAQFMHSYQMDWPTFALVGRTFSHVFPNSVLMCTKSGDFLMLGFKGSSKLVLDNAKRNLPYARQSTNITFLNPRVLYLLVVTEDLDRLFGSGPIHTDNRPRLEFAAPKRMFFGDPAIEINIGRRDWFSSETRKALHGIGKDIDTQMDFAAMALSVYLPFPNMVNLSEATPAQKRRFFKMMGEYCAHNDLDYSIFTEADNKLMRWCCSVQIKALESKIDELPNKALTYFTLGGLCQRAELFGKAVNYYLNTLQHVPHDAILHNDLACALYRLGRLKEAISHFDKALQLEPDYEEARKNREKAASQLRQQHQQKK